MAKQNVQFKVDSYCNTHVDKIEQLNPQNETYNFAVEKIVSDLNMSFNEYFKRSTVERAIRRWKQNKRINIGQ